MSDTWDAATSSGARRRLGGVALPEMKPQGCRGTPGPRTVSLPRGLSMSAGAHFLWAAKGILLGLVSISGECEVVHTSLPIPPSKVAIATCGPLPRGEQMAQERDSLGFRFAVVVALAVIIVATTTWVADHERASAGSIPPSEVIYRAQHLNLF
jgi:hypothetical protein